MKLKKKNKQVYNLTRGPDDRLGVVGWAFSKRSAECIKKIKTKKKACVVVLIYPSVCGGSQHCYNPGRAIPNLITVNSRRAHKCIHFNPEEDPPVSKSVSPRIVSSLNDRNPFVRGGNDSLFFLALGTAYLLSSPPPKTNKKN